MRESNSKNGPQRKYEPPAIVRVHVDAQQELLQTTGCGFSPSSDPQIDCAAQGRTNFGA